MSPFVQAWKATLVLNLLSALVCLGFVALLSGHRLPMGTFGISLLADLRGRPYVVVDHASARGWLLGYDSLHHRLETWEGTIRLQ